MSIEQEICKYFSARFGTDVLSRIAKFKEESKELIDEFESKDHNGFEKKIDELADVTAVLAHLAHIMGVSLDVLLLKAYTKCKIREYQPNYKRDEKR